VLARILQFVIAGHHAGLDDWHSENGSLKTRPYGSDAQREFSDARAGQPHAAILAPDITHADACHPVLKMHTPTAL